MNEQQQRIEAPVRLLERLRPVQEQIDRLSGELRAALLGAQIALDVPDGWVWDGSGWRAPNNTPPPVDGADD